MDDLKVSNGPWRVERMMSSMVVKGARDTICVVSRWDAKNAALIASAPALYAALKECADELDARGCSATFEPLKSALIALKKACGKT
jgi:hypothetical protein